MERKVTVSRLSDSIAADIEQRILEGSLKPGNRLPPERELAVQLGVSRASLREALQKLVSRGLLISRQGGGTYVTDRLEAGFSDPWEEMLRTHPSVHEDLLEFRHMLEAKAAACAAERATDADCERLRACYARLEQAFGQDDLDHLVDQDLAFHQAIAEASHNAIIGHLTASLLRLLRDNLRLNLAELTKMPGAPERLRQQHRAIMESITGRNQNAAGKAAAEHIGYVRDTLAETLKRNSRSESALRRLERSA